TGRRRRGDRRASTRTSRTRSIRGCRTSHRPEPVRPETVPELRFAVRGSEPLPHAAVPTLGFALDVDADAGTDVRAVLLRTHVRSVRSRGVYDVATRDGLVGLRGTREKGASAPGWLTWATTTLAIPPFTGHTVVSLPIVCTYDFEVTASKFFHALDDG